MIISVIGGMKTDSVALMKQTSLFGLSNGTERVSLNVTVFDLKSKIADELLKNSLPRISFSLRFSTIYTDTGRISEHILSEISAVPEIFNCEPFAENNRRELCAFKGVPLISNFFSSIELQKREITTRI